MNVNERLEREKLSKIIGIGKQEITVTHITIRQSIFFLILKLFSIEILAAACLIAAIWILAANNAFRQDFLFFIIAIFVTAVIFKTLATLLTITQWLEEYYEITPTEIIHKNGFLFKKEERHKLIHMKSLSLDQSTLGKIFNFGTLRLNNWSLDKDVYLYLIHNPIKYHKILKDLLQEADTERHTLREHIVDIERGD